MQPNVLRYLANDENSVTSLLRALCILKPFREVVVRLFTGAKFGAADVDFSSFEIQRSVGECIPDLQLATDDIRVAVEIKISDWRGLTDNQPCGYLEWLNGEPVKHRFFVFLFPPNYLKELRQEYERRKTEFIRAHPEHRIIFIEIDWLRLLTALRATELATTCAYTRDFQNFLEGWYLPTPIRFTGNELRETSMYNKTAAAALPKLLELVEKLAIELTKADFEVETAFRNRWWQEDSEYGLYVSIDGKYVLWAGLWMEFWTDEGFPLCLAMKVADEEWSSVAAECFRQAFPEIKHYAKHLVVPIPQHLLMEDAVTHLSEWLLKCYLTKIRDLVAVKPSSRARSAK